MYTAQYSDISITISQFMLKVVGNWISANDAEKRQRKFAVAYTIFSHLLAVYVNFTDIYYRWGDFNYCIYVISTILCVVLSFFKVMVLYILRTEYQKIILYAQKNFWHLKYKGNDKILFMECRKFCKLWAVTACFFIQISVSFYVITPLYGKWIKLFHTRY